MARKMTRTDAMCALASIIIDDPTDIRIGFTSEETARVAAEALSIIRGERWLVSAYRPRKHSRQQTYFCYRVVKTMPSDVFSGASQHESEDEI